MPTETRPKASLGVKKTDIVAVLARANLMYTAILAAAALFVSPPITMAAYLLLLQAAVTAQTATPSRTKGLTTFRNKQIDNLWTAMKALKTYVQGLCDATDVVTAAHLIDSAGLVQGKDMKPTKLFLAAIYVPAT